MAKMPNIALQIGDEIIEKKTTFKYLGVKLDANLTFKDHVDYLCGIIIGKIK